MDDICIRIKVLAEPIARSCALELVDIEYSSAGSGQEGGGGDDAGLGAGKGKGGRAGRGAPGKRARIRNAPTLRVLIDKPGGITVDDCRRVSREMSAILDVEDILPTAYLLEVSSPGLLRPLLQLKDFQNAIGKKLRLKTISSVEGRKNFLKATLTAVAGEIVTIKDSDDRSWTIDIANIKKARLELDF